MITLKPYPEYKDSGLPWLGKIPAHWEVRRNGRLFAQRVETGFPDLPILEVSLRTGVHVRNLDNTQRKQIMSNRGQYKRAARGDIAYNMMRMWQGAVGVAPTDGLVSPAYVVARPYPETETRFYGYLFRTSMYMNEVNKYSRGIVTDRNRLYWDEFKQILAVFPPTDEQRAIAGFLDAHGRAVLRFIGAKQRLIGLLNEQKQAIIHQAVTRGLDPTVCLKPSGIDWLGYIPEDWEIRKLKFIAQSIVGGSTPPSDGSQYWDGDIIWVTPEDVSKAPALNGSARRITLAGLYACSTMLVPPGSIVVTSRAPVGNVALALVELCTNQGCKAIIPRQDVFDAEYGYFLLRVMQSELQSLAKGTTFSEISAYQLANVKVPVPPIGEQKTIVEAVKSKSSPFDCTIDQASRDIDLIREYRTRLIADVVTGKLDVRSVELPALDETVVLDELYDGEEVAELAEETSEVEAIEEENGN